MDRLFGAAPCASYVQLVVTVFICQIVNELVVRPLNRYWLRRLATYLHAHIGEDVAVIAPGSSAKRS